MRPLLVAALLGAGLACSGLLTAPGNDFPCDFSRPPGARDAVCSPGDVCGAQNRCQRFRYEGPQFEGKPTFPFFSDAGAELHPMVLKGSIDFVARVHRAPLDAIVAHGQTGTFRIDRTGVSPLTFPKAPNELEDTILINRGSISPLVMGREMNNEVYFEGGGALNRVRDGSNVLSASRLRAFDADGDLQLAAVTPPPARGGIIRSTGPGADFIQLTNEQPLDVGPGPAVPGRNRSVVILSAQGFRVRQPDGGLPLITPAAFPPMATLATDSTGGVFAVISADQGRVTLSTWRAIRTSSAFELEPAWSDCTPCTSQRGIRPTLAVRPGQDSTGLFVDVLCADEGLRRVRGASSTSLGPCIENALPLPFDFASLALTPRAGLTSNVAVQDFSDPTRFLAGGRTGQIWAGATIGEAVPLFLDRVPTDVMQVEYAGLEGLLALTPVGVFARPKDAALALRANGFRAIAPERTRSVAAFVNDSPRWLVLESGDLAVLLGDVGNLDYGPRLVDGRGEPASRALRGEAVTTLDGGLVSMVVAADDSLYFVPAPTETKSSVGLLGDVTPVLTPEPSTLIRSLALDRTPIGSDGVTRMRGYLVTARNVYEFKLGGAPLRWTATPLPLSGGEPLEVWFDNPRGGLARAGYRDGTIFSLPGGFQLTEPLPANDAGIPAAVQDYENLAGWPVAYTSAGLFVARYDTLPDGKLDTRFPDGGLGKLMTWREVTLPDGSRPWMGRAGRRAEARPGKLFVVADAQTGTDSAYRRLFHLLVFLPDQVLEVAQHERTNISTRLE